MIELDTNDAFEPVLFSSSSKNYIKSNSIIIMLLDQHNSTSHLCLILLLSIILVVLFYITLFMKTYQQAKIKMITKSSKKVHHIHHNKSGGAAKSSAAPATSKTSNSGNATSSAGHGSVQPAVPASKHSIEEHQEAEERGKPAVPQVKMVKGNSSGGGGGGNSSAGATGGQGRKSKEKNRDAPDAIYRKSSVQSISSDVSSTSSDSSSPAKPNRKRNPRISEPPPWSSGGGGDAQGDGTWLRRGSAPPSDDDTSLVISARGAVTASSPPLNVQVESPESPLSSSHHDHVTRTRSHENSRSYGKSRSAYDKSVRSESSKQDNSRSYDNSRQSYDKHVHSSRQDTARYDKSRPAYDKSISIRSVNSKQDTSDQSHKARSQQQQDSNRIHHDTSIRVQAPQQTMDNSISVRSKRETSLRLHENSRSQEDPVVSRLDETDAAYQDDDDETSSGTASSTSSLVSSPGSRSSNVSCSSNSSDDNSSSSSPSPVSHGLDPDSVSYVPSIMLSHHLNLTSVTSTAADTDFNKENLRPPLSSDSPPPLLLPLTRRQKKNRVRRNLELNARIPINKLSRFYQRLAMKDAELHKYLSHYAMTQQQLINFSFPFESKYYANKAVIYSPGRYNSKILDPKAREFVPSPPCQYNVSVNKMMLKNQQILWRPDVLPEDKEEDAQEKICARCNKSFYLVSSPPGVAGNKTTAGNESGNYSYMTQENCHYHWGKVTKSWANGVQNCIYSCCNEEQYKTSGCVYAKLHVWSGLKTGINGPLDGYMKTKPRKTPPPNGYGVYALDTEMVYTVHGLEVARVTVVNVDGRLIYNTLVKPDCEIIDYNTKYSGISAKDYIKNPYKSLKDVQNDLMGFVSKDSIIVGHGLENDMRALKLIHSNIIDTSVLFPHAFGLPFRRSLKSIVSQLLHQSIQSGTHDSFEDARACIDLILWKLLSDFRYNH
uniref:RNA exonuclease 1 homolog n=1 Tax=Cacopsylla melanoneura TaxID=428564 RepID=A0A8D8QME3_9HEMI